MAKEQFRNFEFDPEDVVLIDKNWGNDMWRIHLFSGAAFAVSSDLGKQIRTRWLAVTSEGNHLEEAKKPEFTTGDTFLLDFLQTGTDTRKYPYGIILEFKPQDPDVGSGWLLRERSTYKTYKSAGGNLRVALGKFRKGRSDSK